jgi:hypothetical protein
MQRSENQIHVAEFCEEDYVSKWAASPTMDMNI